jgi:hypothetical protein
MFGMGMLFGLGIGGGAVGERIPLVWGTEAVMWGVDEVYWI